MCIRDSFNTGYMESLQFEICCFYLFHTDGESQSYTQLSSCDEFSGYSLDLNGDNQLQIYPNPTSDILNIKMPISMAGDYNYAIVDTKGKIISQGKINAKLSTINVKAFKTGKYILTLQNSERVIKGHFILMN